LAVSGASPRAIQFQAALPDAGFEAPLLDGGALQLMILLL
jgi:hypothetical protein